MDAVGVNVTQMLSLPHKFRALSAVAIAIKAQSLIRKGASSASFRSIQTPWHLVLISVFNLVDKFSQIMYLLT